MDGLLNPTQNIGTDLAVDAVLGDSSRVARRSLNYFYYYSHRRPPWGENATKTDGLSCGGGKEKGAKRPWRKC